ncbi:MAG: tRNA-guanine transglycosylase [Candidatus Doudnabacteria bacterium]|nr:tRNA-guanine transglycosylase [Candidatus Doudnabacteria bacterium]
MNFFEIKKKDSKSRARLAVLHTSRGDVETPAFLPCGTKSLTGVVYAKEHKFWGARALQVSTLHHWLDPGDQTIKKAGGLHKVLDWDRAIFSDSGGGFLAEKLVPRLVDPRMRVSDVLLTEEGVTFRSGSDRTLKKLTPESSVQMQLNFGSDAIQTLLFVPPASKGDKQISKALRICADWPARARQQFAKAPLEVRKKTLLFATLGFSFGGKLSENSIRANDAPGADGYAVCGIGQAVAKSEFSRRLRAMIGRLDRSKPLQVSGLGDPKKIILAIDCGADLIDSLTPYASASLGRALAFAGQPGGYRVIELSDARMQTVQEPLDRSCGCFTCLNHFQADLAVMFGKGDETYWRLLGLHNVKFYCP